jgi:hypothetical protein
MKMIQLYKESSITGMVKTTNGEMNYLEWLERERDRINSDPSRYAVIKTSKTGRRASLWVNNVEGVNDEL